MSENPFNCLYSVSFRIIPNKVLEKVRSEVALMAFPRYFPSWVGFSIITSTVWYSNKELHMNFDVQS